MFLVKESPKCARKLIQKINFEPVRSKFDVGKTNFGRPTGGGRGRIS